jgi:hypothetical protein
VWCIYKLHKRKFFKARGLQNITKTLTILEIWTDARVTVQTEAQWVHNAQNVQRTEDLLAHSAQNAQRNEVLLAHNAWNVRLWVGTPTHIMICVGGDFKLNSPLPAPNLALDR